MPAGRRAAAAAGRPARFGLISDSLGTSAIAFDAAKIYFGENSIFDDATDTIQTTWGSRKRVVAWGAPALLIAASLALVSSCASKAPQSAIFQPPVSDLAVEAKPVLDPSALASDAALTAHDDAIESWGERGWDAVARLCRWAVETGADGLECPPPRQPDPG